MTWIGKRVINIDTMVEGKIVDTYNYYTHTLYIDNEDGTKTTITMNNICESRESEITSNEKYKMMFWENKGKWLAFGDVNFVKDPKQLWINSTKLDPSIAECEGFKQAMLELDEVIEN